MTENTDENQVRSGQWRQGQSGNPAGKPPGCRNRATRAAEMLLEGEAEALSRKAIELALNGDTTALRLCLERLVPPRRGRSVQIDLPEIKSATDVLDALAAVIGAAARGEIALDEAVQLAAVLEAKRKAVETAAIEVRLAALERSMGTQP